MINALPTVDSLTVNRTLFDSITLLVTAAVSLVLLIPAALNRFSRRVKPAPAPAEFGPEPPAVVSAILNRGLLPPYAASATLVDLAARGILQIEEVGPRLSLVRFPATDPPSVHGLLPHEEMVYRHVRSLAAGDVVPTEALGESARDVRRWRREFASQVIADAGADRVFRERPLGFLRLVLRLNRSALVGCVITTLLYKTATGWKSGPVAGYLAGVTLTVMSIACLAMYGRFRLTDRGREIASTWLGVRHRLTQAPPLSDLPAAAVTNHGRQLAYATALGLADEAADSLPVSGPRNKKRVWSPGGGLWRSLGITPSVASKPSTVLLLYFAVVPMAAAIVAGAIMLATHLITGSYVVHPALIAIPCLLIVAVYTPASCRAVADIVRPHPRIEARILRKHRSVIYTSASDRRRQRSPHPVCTVLLALPQGGKAKEFGLEQWLYERLPPEGAMIRAYVAAHSGWIFDAEAVKPETGP